MNQNDPFWQGHAGQALNAHNQQPYESIESRVQRRIGEIQRELDAMSDEKKQQLWSEMARLRAALTALKGE